MICKLYGDSIEVYVDGEMQKFYNFPRFEQLKEHLDTMLDDLKPTFGFVADHLVAILLALDEFGGEEWLESLRDKPHRKARKMLTKIRQVGSYVSLKMDLQKKFKHCF